MGKRGPKKGAVYEKNKDAEQIRLFFRQRISEEKEALVNAMVDKAKGCAIIDKKDDTGERIYDLPPDPQAFKALMEHGIGKPPQPIEGTGEDGELIVKVIKYADGD